MSVSEIVSTVAVLRFAISSSGWKLGAFPGTMERVFDGRRSVISWEENCLLGTKAGLGRVVFPARRSQKSYVLRELLLPLVEKEGSVQN